MKMTSQLCVSISILCLARVFVASQRTTLEDYIDTCMDGKYQKSKPGPEASLFEQCLPWQNRSCCTTNVTQDLHVSNAWHNFNWNHCAKPLSEPCTKHLIQDLCFYECSPNVGPWLVPQKIRIRNERFVGVPLCKTECDAWFNACKDDFTCKDNWAKGWNWTSGGNVCPTGSTCRTFSETYQTAKNMCEKIWGGSYSVVPDNQPCMLLWFDGAINPNDEIARQKAIELTSSGNVILLHLCTVIAASIAIGLTVK